MTYTSTLGFGILRRSTSSIHGVVGFGILRRSTSSIHGVVGFGILRRSTSSMAQASFSPGSRSHLLHGVVHFFALILGKSAAT